MIYSWQQQLWQQVNSRHQTGVLPHALLLKGIKGTGKRAFAKHFLQLLLCEATTFDEQCHCKACALIAACTHPNVFWVQAASKGHAIKIDQIRAITYFINETGFRQQRQIVVIDPVDALNIQAVNALLKTLEEPPSHSYLVLISDDTNRLPATLLSRCQTLHFALPSFEEALRWLKQKNLTAPSTELSLQLAGGAPLKALELLQSDYFKTREQLYKCLIDMPHSAHNALKQCEQLKETELHELLDLLHSFFSDVMKLKLNLRQSVHNQDYLPQMEIFAQEKSMIMLSNCLWSLVSIRKKYHSGIHFNKQMLFENLLLKWSGTT